ncbi:MAG: DUF4143 domain-containing protein, partial [Fibrobacterota bacterium]
GASWEGFALEQILGVLGRTWEASFYRTSSGSEVDLILRSGDRIVGVEFKASMAPVVSRGFWHCLEDLGISDAWIVSPVKASFPYKKAVTIGNISDFLDHINPALKVSTGLKS